MLILFSVGIMIIFLIVNLIIRNTATTLIRNMDFNQFYSESEKTLTAFTATKPHTKKASLVFLDENCLNQALNEELVSDTRQYKEMELQKFMSNMTYFDIYAIIICYETNSNIKKFSLKKDTFFKLAKKYL